MTCRAFYFRALLKLPAYGGDSLKRYLPGCFFLCLEYNGGLNERSQKKNHTE